MMSDCQMHEACPAEAIDAYRSLRPSNSSIAAYDGEFYYFEMTDGRLDVVIQVGGDPLGPAQMTPGLSDAIEAEARKVGLL